MTFSTTSPQDELTLFGHHWQNHTNPETPKAVISLVHGLGEHAARYHPMADWLGTRGIAMVAIDLRGHGLSQGKRGVCREFDHMMDDIEALTDYTKNAYPDHSHYLMGHSMGGNLVFNYALLRNMAGIAGVIAQAPALRPVAKVPGLQKTLLKMLRPVLPDFTASNGLNPADISRDPEEISQYVTDPLVHDRIGVGLALDLISSGEIALENASQLGKPLLLMHGEADEITSASATAEFAKAAGRTCTHKEFPDAFHEIHNEEGREEVYETIAGWIEGQLT